MSRADSRYALKFVTAVSRWTVLQHRLAKSECLSSGQYPLHALWNAASAAEALNGHLTGISDADWVIWVHQDVSLPPGWDKVFLQAISEAEELFEKIAVVGVYGVRGAGKGAKRLGCVLDRGVMLREAAALPSVADSLDELLFAVKPGMGLQLDPALKFDFYATDIVLQAQQMGYQAVVVDAFCEHWSDTPRRAPFPDGLIDRVVASGRQFESKWTHRLPITTPIAHIDSIGAVERTARGLSSGTLR